MNHHTLMITIAIFFIQITTLNSTPHISHGLSCFSFSRKMQPNPHTKKPRILSLCTLAGRGGIEVSTLALHKQLLKEAYDPIILVGLNTFAQQSLYDQKISHYASKAHSALAYNDYKLYKNIWIKQIRELCKDLHIDIVQCNLPEDALLARQATQGLSTKVILMFHAPRLYALECFKNLDAVLPVNIDIAHQLNGANQDLKLGITHIMHLLPFFDEEKCLYFKPSNISKKQFFKKNFNITIDAKLPIICMNGNFYGPAQKPYSEFIFQKNQELLIRALHKLMYERKKRAHLFFIGDGPNRAWHENLVRELKLTNYAHFLGFQHDTCNILEYSTIHILASREESFGIAHIEAALHKKPSLGAEQTGAQYIIIDGMTGFVFKNNDINDLTNKLEFLIANPEQCKLMGNNAFNFITESKHFKQADMHFLTQAKFNRLSTFYKKIIKIGSKK